MRILLVVIIGFLLDLWLGDPEGFPHPVRLMGWVITRLEPPIRRILPPTPAGEWIGGTLLTLTTLSLSVAVPLLLLWGAQRLHPLLGLVLESLFCYQLLATKSLRVESMRVYYALTSGSLPGARDQVSRIVGRDTAALTAPQVTKAAVETVAENACDGVIAPLFFLLLGGAPLGFLYKAINTLDSMIGYKNDRYLYFGRFAARLDDMANFIPAILSAWMMLAASALLGLDSHNAYRIYRRDRHNHKSPNSAKTESVCAGALRVQLAGDACYFGQPVHKPTIGDDQRPVVPEDIITANNLMYLTALLSLLLLGGARLLGVLAIF